MKKTLSTVCSILAVAAFGVFIWYWGFCRFYVQPNEMAVITSKTGEALPPGQILAEEGQKGIRSDVLGEGRHFLNPILYDWEIMKVQEIPPGKVGIVTSKVGQELPEGEFLADKGEKGIWRIILGPGKYRFNPFGYQIDVVDAISIPIGYAGVITSLSGNQPQRGQFARQNEKGVREDILQPGLYYVNPKEYKVDVLEIGVNQVSLLGRTGGKLITKGKLETQNLAIDALQSNVLREQKKKRVSYLSDMARSSSRKSVTATPEQQEARDLERVRQEYIQGDSMATLGLPEFVEFPSRDGFQISLDMTVEFELLPAYIAGIFSRYGDLPAVVDKIIMPQITSISRNKGSEYRAKDFIMGEGREKFQNELTQSLAQTLELKNLIVHNALIRHVEVPMQILSPIQLASIAIQQDLTNKEKQNTAKKLAELNTELQLIEQRREQVAQETTKIKAEIKADQEKEVAEIGAEALRRVAEIGKETASFHADIERTIAGADAEALERVEGAMAAGLDLKAAAFKDASAFPLWHLARELNPEVAVQILHAGEGTLWTDLKNARMSDLGGAQVIQE